MRTKFPVLLMTITLLVATAGFPTRAQQPVPRPPTFSRDVAPILFTHCVSCHRPGEAAPISLLTYEQARPYARAIANAVANRTMPPWHAEAPAGTFQNERLLSDAERQTLTAWATGGAVEGNPKEMPLAPVFADGWTLGTPDIVLVMNEDYPIPARGAIEYEHFYVPTNFTEPRWITSFEIKPGNRQLVHHVILAHVAKPNGTATLGRANAKDMVTPRPRAQGARPRRDVDPTARRIIATYAPGTNPQRAPAGTAFLLEPGGTLEFQMHYTTNGVAGTDRTSVGITFAKDAPSREVRAQQFFNGTLRLPADTADVAVSTDFELLQDATVWGLFPHTHLRGKRWEYKLALPNGETKSILSVPRYDFNWQTYYMFATPIQAPKGSKIVSTAWYDNSKANKSNPDPTVDVEWGDQTWEEMQYTGILLSPR